MTIVYLHLISVSFIILIIDEDENIHGKEMKIVGGSRWLTRVCTLYPITNFFRLDSNNVHTAMNIFM